MPKREDEYWAGMKEPKGRGLCPFCGSSNIYYNKHYKTWRCGRCEKSFPTPSYGPGGDFGKEARWFGKTTEGVRRKEFAEARAARQKKSGSKASNTEYPFDSEHVGYYRGEYRGRRIKGGGFTARKAFLIFLLVACLVAAIYTGYLLFTNRTDLVIGTIIFGVGIGVLIWNISVLRKLRVGTRTVVAIAVAIALLGATTGAFAGVEPLASYKDAIVNKVSPVARNVRVELFPTDEEIQTEAFGLINEARIESGLALLTSDALLTSLAMEHCQYMKRVGTCSHSGFDGRAAIVLGNGHLIVGENVAEGYYSAETLVAGWLNSSGHRENILNPQFRHTGLGYTGGYACQIFSD